MQDRLLQALLFRKRENTDSAVDISTAIQGAMAPLSIPATWNKPALLGATRWLDTLPAPRDTRGRARGGGKGRGEGEGRFQRKKGETHKEKETSRG